MENRLSYLQSRDLNIYGLPKSEREISLSSVCLPVIFFLKRAVLEII